MKIGFMQGRLCDRVDGKIQAFPWQDWEQEFPVAKQIDIKLMEWTLDQDNLYENPLMTETGRAKIKALSNEYQVAIDSLTGDCFMQAPFFKADDATRGSLLEDLSEIIKACADVGIKYVLIPLVDNGSIQTLEQQESLIEGLLPLSQRLIDKKMKIVFESDFPPEKLASFIALFPEDAFGINYDIGNSAALGYSPEKEIYAYGHRIDNVHIKDRVLHGTTVPLGTGNANFPAVFEALKKSQYSGNFILQTARADDNQHAAAISRYRDMANQWWNDNAT